MYSNVLFNEADRSICSQAKPHMKLDKKEAHWSKELS